MIDDTAEAEQNNGADAVSRMRLSFALVRRAAHCWRYAERR